jgi:hypothetical protein
MQEISSETVARIASALTPDQRELLLCFCRWAINPILKPELRELAQADRRYEVQCAESTYSDRLRRLIKDGLVCEDPCDSRTVWVTRLGFLVRDYLFDEQKRKIMREISDDMGANVPLIAGTRTAHTGEVAS